MPDRALSTAIICNSVEYLLLCKRMIVRDVINIPRRFLVVSGQQEALRYIGHIAKRQRIVSSPDNDSLAILHALSYAAEVQSISRAKEGAGTKDHRLHTTVEHQTPDKAVTFCLRNAVWIGI